MLGQLEVIFGVTLAWIWAGEHLSINTLSGGSLVLGALVANELVRIARERKARGNNLRYDKKRGIHTNLQKTS